MKVILQFLKPHRKLCIVTILLFLVDIVGALIIPTYAAQMLNISTLEGTAFNTLLMICVKMLAAAVISGISMILSSYLCADLTSKVAADMKNALYKKRSAYREPIFAPSEPHRSPPEPFPISQTYSLPSATAFKCFSPFRSFL